MRLVTATQAEDLFQILDEVEQIFGDYQFQ
jgi:hypothetical protein